MKEVVEGRVVLGVIVSDVMLARRARWDGVVRKVLKEEWRSGETGFDVSLVGT